MLAVTASPRGLAAILLNEASLSQELCTVGLLQPHILIEYQWQNIGLSLEYSAQQTRRRLRVATPSELLVSLSISSSSPVDDIPLGSGSCASRTLALSKCRPPISLRYVI